MERIANRVRELRQAGESSGESSPTPEEIAQMIDHTILKPEASIADIEKLCDEARDHHFYSVCVNPTYVKQSSQLLSGSDVKVCCVVGFPLGASSPETKAMEARRAIREGAKEIDMVINVGAMKSGNEELVLRDIRTVSEACRDGSALLKVILETSLLTAAEIVRVCEMSMKAGADFVKTSTGFGSAGAKAENIRLMAHTVAPRNLGVKASGGVRTYEDAMEMIQAGATRIGASSGIKIVEGARKKQGIL
jgi:deoxyribose-phosphate aldolase